MPDGRRDPDRRLAQLAEEHAAWRRIATLVARGATPEELFSAVSTEVGKLFGADAVIARVEPDGTAMVVVGLTDGIPVVTIGTRWELKDFPSTEVLRTGRATRTPQKRRPRASGAMTDALRERGGVASVSAPIAVDGKTWGVITVAETRKVLAEDAEERLGRFSELVAIAIANNQAREHLAQLAAEQAALRRVATLVARGVSPDELFSEVNDEIGQLFDSEASIARFEADGSGVVIVAQTAGIPIVSIGIRWELDDLLATTRVYRTGRPARNDWTGLETATGPTAERLRKMNFTSTVAAPIVVEGALWGVMTVSHPKERLPPDAEERVERFTELVATAIANAESRGELAASEARAHELAREQAALRRVATLVAESASADELFAAVAQEVADVLAIPVVGVQRFETDGTFTMMGIAGETLFTVGSRWPVEDEGLAGMILATGRPARKDDYAGMPGPLGAAVRDDRMVATVGVPIIVEGSTWGFMVGAARPGRPIPPDVESRLNRFTELLGTAIANADSQAALAASRARIIAASDDARRRIERDLHDGAQQRIVVLMAELRTIEATMPTEPEATRASVSRVADGLASAVHELRELSRGIHPAVLTRGGLTPALKALKRRSAVRVTLDMHVEHRLPDQVEAAAYFTVSEALANVSRHANATRTWVALRVQDDALLLSIRDDGVGGADASRGSGLTGLTDRIEALGGHLQIESPPGRGTTIEVAIPIAGHQLTETASRTK